MDLEGDWMGVLGGAALAGAFGLAAGEQSKDAQEDTNAKNIQLGREQMAFQKEMSGSAYQRGIEDMKKAGINPMLASKVGGASTPSGAMPQVENATSTGISSAVQGAGLVTAAQQIMSSKAQTEQMNAQTSKIKSETLENALHSARAQWELEKIKGDAKGSAYDGLSKEAIFDAMNAAGADKQMGAGFKADVDKRKAEAESAKFGLARDKTEADFYGSNYGAGSPYIKSLLDIIKGVSAARR